MKRLIIIGILIISLFLALGCQINDVTSESVATSENDTTSESDVTSSDTTHIVRFDSMGGTSIASLEVLHGNPLIKPDDPTRDNFSFQGWYKTQEMILENVWDFDVDRVTEDTILYAGWILLEDVTFTESLTFELVNSTYVVTGVGDEVDVVIPQMYQGIDVTGIGEASFARKKIKSVILPDSILEIGLNAFHNCDELETIYISENSKLTKIGNNAFSGNSSLKSIYLPATMTSLGDNVFNNCGEIEHFIVASTNPVYRSMNSHLVQIDTMTLIRGANQVNIPEGIINIAQAAFRRSTLEKIEIPASLVSIGNYVFNDCESLAEIVVANDSENFSSLCGILYNKLQTELIYAPIALSGDIELAPSLLEIPYIAFDGRSGITSIYIYQGSLTSILNFAFRNTTLMILFAGSEEEWNQIEKKSLWGGSELTIEYNSQKEEPTANSNILVVYFSWSGRTESVAQNIASKTGADLVEIIPQVPYTTNYSECLNVARSELNSDARPEISLETYNQINIEDYEYIFIGYPIWYGYEPMIIRSFIEHYDNLANKTVYPFDTSASSSGNSAYRSIQNLCSNAVVSSFLHLNDSGVLDMDNRVSEWLDDLNLPQTAKRIKMTFSSHEIYITLGDTTPAKDLLARLEKESITLSFSDFAGSEKIAYPSPVLDISNTTGYDPSAGDVVIYAPWNNIAIFYEDSSGYSSSLIYVGTVDSDGIALLAAQSNNFEAVLSLE